MPSHSFRFCSFFLLSTSTLFSAVAAFNTCDVLTCTVFVDRFNTTQVSLRCDNGQHTTTRGDERALDHPEPVLIVTANRNPNCTGWMNLSITRHPDLKHDGCDLDCFGYAAGVAEGALFAMAIEQHFTNAAAPMLLTFNATAMEWVQENVAFMRHHAWTHTGDPYWRHVSAILSQLDGLTTGYGTQIRDCAGTPVPKGCLAKVDTAPEAIPRVPLSFIDIYIINLVFEMPDIVLSLGSLEDGWKLRPKSLKGYGGCSALVRLTDKDLFAAQTMWTQYAMMLRVAKVYQFLPTRVLFSSFPGTVHSGDDWYTTGHGMTVMETTIVNYNASLAQQSVVTNSVAEFIRIGVANQMGDSGPEWSKVYSNFNSGTYNNQWMVVDMKRVRRDPKDGTIKLDDGALWVLEQLPGLIASGDQTDVLRKTGYWASYNIPFYPSIYVASDTELYYQKYGDFFSYTKYSRALIFKRNVSDAVDFPTIKALMRYNNWRFDPLSDVPIAGAKPIRSPRLAIAARGDLEALNVSYGNLTQFMGPDAFGAIDCKLTSFALLEAAAPKHDRKHPHHHHHRPAGEEKKNNGTLPWATVGTFISGPTAEQQPVFDWTTYKSIFALTPHFGQPSRFEFEWTLQGDIERK